MFTQDRELLDDKPDIPVTREQFIDLAIGLLAIATAIIHEFDNGDVAVRVAANPTCRVVENIVCVDLQQGFFTHRRTFCAALFQHGDRFHQHFGIFQQIRPHFGAERAALVICHDGLRCQGRGAHQHGEGGGGDQSVHESLLRIIRALRPCPRSMRCD